ncbi:MULTISPECIES: HD domain-containing protein [Lentibacter]|jgi:putative hydrolases of HD superfamily|uniref:Putative hydrolases of HD superfamily n=1 Tax=Lentibacter algarum TaxID=576131 RepID=A0A1H3KTU1_9RHOB|nr:HD domain-containing protein [Lentibacter algarum]WIF31750.1 putative hydrolase of HD superfamily protein [Lentibacter algarum]SDY55436.1 putative hydrolases of HD superfamily [Lentibacter algarum]
MSNRLDAQMAFLMEADKLKQIVRGTTLADGSRYENSGEHSWHIALFALVLGADAPTDVKVDRVIKMLLLHDIVEIDAGDAPIFGDHDATEMAAKEEAAATRLFGLLPPDQAQSFRALWDEFEAAQTPDARFAKSLDRFQPPNQNLASGGGSWIEYNTDYSQFEARVGNKIKRGAPWLWTWLQPKAEAWFAARGRL